MSERNTTDLDAALDLNTAPDLGTVHNLLHEARVQAAIVESDDTHDHDEDRHGRAKRVRERRAAERNKRLLYVIHLCRRAATEAEAVYMTQRGFSDLLATDPDTRP